MFTIGGIFFSLISGFFVTLYTNSIPFGSAVAFGLLAIGWFISAAGENVANAIKDTLKK